MAKGQASIVREISTEFEGRQISASYSVAGVVVTVWTAHGRKTTQLGSSPVHSLARIMLRELAQEGKV
jgi:hypothetical protein